MRPSHRYRSRAGQRISRTPWRRSAWPNEQVQLTAEDYSSRTRRSSGSRPGSAVPRGHDQVGPRPLSLFVRRRASDWGVLAMPTFTDWFPVATTGTVMTLFGLVTLY